ncbi:MAG: flagellar basal-body rod protein FlgG [Syntrophobacteraceae bacterium CG2_30_61_12]|nr:MAG: flagellar basal-body rod protein FlgG [Syntrophobacteraceae bacterium CG2_30_61_12]PIU30819.1 MAG: flagellar basal-body rod protein FlgG [Syntrophobacteraceae bacterium CG07_land_8_20_14_0_80_61_8]
MMRSLWTAATGMAAQQMNMDVIANNLANANTAGFKRSRANFEDMMYQTILSPGSETSNDTLIPTGIQVGLGAKPVSVQKIFSQGNFINTENPLDIAIEGEGFFKIMKGTDEVYTRAGSFKLDQNGYLVDGSGNRLQPEIAIPANAVSVAIDTGGTLTAVDQTGKVLTSATINTHKFINPGGLLSAGHGYFIPTEASGDAAEGLPGSEGYGGMLQGFVENSNIDVVEEMVNMIVGQRAYEANSKVIKAADDMLQMANSVKA